MSNGKNCLARRAKIAISGTRHAGVAESVDATDLNDLSALGETLGAELLKFGETCEMAIPSQARRKAVSDGKV